MDRGSGSTVSPWIERSAPGLFPALKQDAVADVCVVGAGIAGLSVAYALARAGLSVIVLEDGVIGSGETSRTTAHLASAFDDRYYHMAQLHGEDGARLLAESHAAAIDSIESIAAEENIECGFERLDGYLFVPPGDPQEQLDQELEACNAAGLTDVSFVDRAPIADFETGRCLRFPRQGQFDPMRYLSGLAQAIVRRGGHIFTGTHVSTIEEGKDGQASWVRVGEAGPVVTARDIVVATNTPVQDRLTIHTKQYPYRTYVIGARVPHGSVTRALYWDTPDPYHYVRTIPAAGYDLLIVGGEDHKTGQEHDALERYARLEAWGRERFPMMGTVEYEWSGQVVEPMDGVAFIGRNPGDEHVWVVTGDSGNGMTHGALAGILLDQLIRGREHRWAHLYDPSRKSLRAGLEFTRENFNMALQYASWLTRGDVSDESEIPPGAGAVVRAGLHKLAVYRDPAGVVHRLSAKCPHLGAVVTWNAEELTWDCPAHGSRFDCRGKVVNGPANVDLDVHDDGRNDSETGSR